MSMDIQFKDLEDNINKFSMFKTFQDMNSLFGVKEYGDIVSATLQSNKNAFSINVKNCIPGDRTCDMNEANE